MNACYPFTKWANKKFFAQFPSKRQMFAFEKDFKMQHVFVRIEYPGIIVCKANGTDN